VTQRTAFNPNVRPQTDWQGRVTGYEAKRVFPNLASASKGQDELDAINPAGFEPTPFGAKGEPFDPPEATQPSPDPVGNQPPNCLEGGEYRAALQYESASGDLDAKACAAGVCGTSD
jgi:hypothetical protein